MAYEFGPTTPGELDPRNPVSLVFSRTGETDLNITPMWGVDPQAPTPQHVLAVINAIIVTMENAGYTFSGGVQTGAATFRQLQEVP